MAVYRKVKWPIIDLSKRPENYSVEQYLLLLLTAKDEIWWPTGLKALIAAYAGVAVEKTATPQLAWHFAACNDFLKVNKCREILDRLRGVGYWDGLIDHWDKIAAVAYEPETFNKAYAMIGDAKRGKLK